MNSFIKDRLHVEGKLAQLERMSPHGMRLAIRQIQKEAEEQSPFKKGQLVRACTSPGFSLVEMDHLPHDHNDPKQHFDTRVMGWDTFGRIQVATPKGTNPHGCENAWGDDKLAPRDDQDWVQYSKYKPGMRFFFIWELYGFDCWPPGTEIRGVIEAPHILFGDWRIRYPRDPSRKSWITRVLNEGQMRRP